MHLTLLVLRVSDLEASAAFYRCLGLTLVPEQHAEGPRHYSGQLGPTVLELYPALGRPVTRVRLGLAVASVVDTVAAAEAQGANVLTASDVRAVLVDPDNNRVVVVRAPSAE